MGINRSLQVLTLAACLVAALESAAAARRIGRRGDLRLTGQAAVQVETFLGSRGNATTLAVLSITPEIGYFVVPGLALAIGTRVLGRAGEGTTNVSVAPLVGVDYVFGLNAPVGPYLGFRVGPEIQLQGGDAAVLLDVGFPVGVFVAVGNSAWLNFGVMPEFHVSFSGGALFTIPIGFLGISAVF